MKIALLVGCAVSLLVMTLLAAACEGSNQLSDSESYREGNLSISASMLDVGLLKGDATAEAKGDWRVAEIKVTATDPDGSSWGVLEFPEGVGSPSASEFFEVQLQELSRGEQLQITLIVTFESDTGKRVERQAEDRWPP